MMYAPFRRQSAHPLGGYRHSLKRSRTATGYRGWRRTRRELALHSNDDHRCIIASVCGTGNDAQGLEAQSRMLRDAKEKD